MSKTSRYSPKISPTRRSIRQLFYRGLFFFFSASIISVLALGLLPAPTSSFMLYRHYEDLVDKHRYQAIDYQWVSANRMAKTASAAVIASEDQLFYHHLGFDLHAIKLALNASLNGGQALRGASTITQQVAKNLFLIPSKSFIRKGLEAWFTILIELFWTKDRILTVYLNIAEFGDHLFGIEAASQRYFNCSANQLSRAQAALLAATLPNPLKLKADKPTSYVLKRQNWILRQMSNQAL